MNDNQILARHQQPFEVFQAEGKLSALLDVTIEQAVVSLELRAQFRGLSLAEAAREVLSGPNPSNDAPPKIDDATLTILRQHLDCSSSPLDHMN